MPATQQAAKPQTQANGTGNLGQICTSSLMQSDLFFSPLSFEAVPENQTLRKNLLGPEGDF